MADANNVMFLKAVFKLLRSFQLVMILELSLLMEIQPVD